MSEAVDLGFVEECEPWRLESRFFPSKVGGKPAWLDLKNLPRPEKLLCDYCDNPCIFLCQIYAPLEESAFHRTIYVFICKNPNCCKENSNGNLKVFRSQLSRDNEFYPANPPIEEESWRQDIKTENWSTICTVCGIFSSSHCSKCKKVNYCSRSHQIWDWKNGHKSNCEKNETVFLSNKFLFPEFELLIEEEKSSTCDKNLSSEKELEKYTQLVESGEAGSLQSEENIDNDLLNMANSLEDKTFLKFKKKIELNPEQVLRYNRSGAPLFISSVDQPKNIPKCEECNGERQFEFQIMPQLLIDLREEDISKTIDWGVLLVYTCKNSCVPRSKYIKEYIWKQDVKKENYE